MKKAEIVSTKSC